MTARITEVALQPTNVGSRNPQGKNVCFTSRRPRKAPYLSLLKKKTLTILYPESWFLKPILLITTGISSLCLNLFMVLSPLNAPTTTHHILSYLCLLMLLPHWVALWLMHKGNYMVCWFHNLGIWGTFRDCDLCQLILPSGVEVNNSQSSNLFFPSWEKHPFATPPFPISEIIYM